MEGAPLGFIEYEPPSVGDGPAPLLVYLHGSGESGDGNFMLVGLYGTGIPRLLDTDNWPEDRPFIVLMPQFGPDPDHCTDPSLINEFLHYAISAYPVDPARVYLTGVSCGAFGTWEYLGEHTNELVAAAVPMAGDGNDAFQTAGCALGRVPIWAIHGEIDRNVDSSGSSVPIGELNNCTNPAPVDARITLVPNVSHSVWQPFYDGTAADIYSWMLQYTNPGN